MTKNLLPLVCILALSFYACKNDQPAAPRLEYPKAEKGTQVDDYFGTKIADPYRWMEDDTSAKVKAWVEAQNKLTFGYLDKIPYREAIKERLTEIWNYERYSAPYRKGEYYFFSKNDGLQNQSVIYYQKGLDGAPEVFIDPNAMSADGTASVRILGFSKDKKYVAYSIQQSGSDWGTIRVMEVATKKVLDDQLDWVKFSGAAWHGNGFYYSRYDKPAAGKEFSQKNEHHKVYYHLLGNPQEKDELVYEDKSNPLRYHYGIVTEDERFLVIAISQGTYGDQLYCRDLTKKEPLRLITPAEFEHNYWVVNSHEGKLLVVTDDGAPNQRLVSIDPAKPARENWTDIIPEKKEPLEDVNTGGGKLFATYLQDVATRLYQYDMAGNPEREIALPALGQSSNPGGSHDDTTLFYGFTSFTYPSTIYKYDIAGGKSEVWKKPAVKFNPEDYETKQVFYNSKDGTRIPMFLVHKKGLRLDGSNPTLLYAYGGFNISMQPSFSTSTMVLLENGGVYAMANLRGGGEYGDAWHKAGMLLNKQNVFDDFIAAAQYLISEKYTSPEKLAISGRSNGGLLVGAAITQHPELFKVAFPGVGVMDMLRYHKFTVGWGWTVEYGSSDSLEHFKNLLAYSPLHNIKERDNWPATMVITADHDDRVVPAHSFKFTAALQENNKGANPTLIRVDTKAGHGAGTPTTKLIEEQADVWSFMFYNMGVTPIYKQKE